MSESSADVIKPSELTPSTQSLEPNSVDLTACIDTFRRTVLKETADIVSAPTAADPEYCARCFPRMVAMLASSLEELRVAEEDLAEQASSLLSRDLDHERHMDYERRLFDFAPTALLATDLMGAITEANNAAVDLFGRAKDHLDQKPVVAFVPLEERATFREQLGRMTLADGTTDWRFRILRRRELPLTVSATVHVVGRGNRSGGTALFWSLRTV